LQRLAISALESVRRLDERNARLLERGQGALSNLAARADKVRRQRNGDGRPFAGLRIRNAYLERTLTVEIDARSELPL
jgi:hypothetical protein